MKKNTLLWILSILVIILIAGVVGKTVWQKYGEKNAGTSETKILPEPEHPAEAMPLDWQTYIFPETNFQLQYPQNLFSAKTKLTALTLQHSVPFPTPHIDPCDFRGDAPDLKDFTDFHVTFTLLPQDFVTVVTAKEGPSFAKIYEAKKNHLNVSPGFIDPVSIGALNGFQITMGVENCGVYHYYFPINENMTLFVERDFITMFRDDTMRTQVEKLPNVFSPEKEESWFQALLKTFQEQK